MFDLLSALLADRKGGIVFTCFGLWHILYLSAALGLILFLVNAIRRLSPERRSAMLNRFMALAFGLYIADFFLMPFAYGKIDVEKLPFHVCTAMCVMCYLSRNSGFWGRFRREFAALGFLSNFVYLVYPAGVMWHGVHPLSYRVIQTLGFHAVMTAYGLLCLVFESPAPVKTPGKKDLVVIAGMVLWALAGNWLYGSSTPGHPYNFNWFFVTADPFGLLPASLGPWVMPVLNITLFFGVEFLVYSITALIRRTVTKGEPL